jgi:hypothetical protein
VRYCMSRRFASPTTRQLDPASVVGASRSQALRPTEPAMGRRLSAGADQYVGESRATIIDAVVTQGSGGGANCWWIHSLRCLLSMASVTRLA